jgi:hypothetical protein
MDEERELLLVGFDAETRLPSSRVATFTVVKSGEVVVSATGGAVSPRESGSQILRPRLVTVL